MTGADQSTNIKVTSCTLTELFRVAENAIGDGNNKIQGQLTIPEYQRPYQWGAEEVHKLVKDLTNYFQKKEKNEKPMYYLGSVILHQQGEALNIIDGQQRITTMALISKYANQNCPAIRYKSPISLSNINNNYQSLNDKIVDLKDIDASKINLTLIVTENEDDAYTFFETQNTGGIRLSGVDIIKAHHLRTFKNEHQRSHYALLWEKQKSINLVIFYLLKARRWGLLKWQDVPHHKEELKIKHAVIEEFSGEEKEEGKEGKAYQTVAFASTPDGFQVQYPQYRFFIRQPLVKGQNFIEYLESFCDIYRRLFINQEDKEIRQEFYTFNKELISRVDGTAYLKEFFEVAMLCYVHRFGVMHILEAAFWIFRFSYSIRVTNEKTVRESSIRAFIRKEDINGRKQSLFDYILQGVCHEQVIFDLKNFKYEPNSDNTKGNTVKKRFVDNVFNYFYKDKKESDGDISKFDEELIKGINDKLKP